MFTPSSRQIIGYKKFGIMQLMVSMRNTLRSCSNKKGAAAEQISDGSLSSYAANLN